MLCNGRPLLRIYFPKSCLKCGYIYVIEFTFQIILLPADAFIAGRACNALDAHEIHNPFVLFRIQLMLFFLCSRSTWIGLFENHILPCKMRAEF
jgi:hypothetical protein